MRRIRTIKPEMPENESVGRLSRDARLLWLQLPMLADDEGRLRGAPKLVAAQLYPYDDDAPPLVPGWLDEIEAQGLIRRYMVDRASYIEILTWQQDQKIDRPSKSKLPGPEKSDVANDAPSVHPPNSREASSKIRDTSTKLRERSTTDLDLDLDLDPDQDRERGVAPSAPPAPRSKIGRRLPQDWSPSEEDRHFASDFGLDTDAVVAKFCDYWRSVSGAKATKTDWSATWRNWCRNERPPAGASLGRAGSHLEKSAESARKNVARMAELQCEFLGDQDDFVGITLDAEPSHAQ